MNKHISNVSKGCVPEVDLDYSKELCELNSDYHLVPDKIKREMLSHCHLKIADFYNIPIGNVKKLVPNILVKKNMCLIMKTYNFT